MKSSASPFLKPTPAATLDRRRFLRNIGVCLSLPALETFSTRALANTGGTAMPATTATGAPLRTAFLYFPNGAIPSAWWPTGEGTDFQLNRTMEPLANVKKHIQVLGGLTDLSANAGRDGGGDHARANGTFLTGVRIKKTNGADVQAGISIDQVMAQQIGLLTPFRSLELSCDTILNVGTCDTDYSCIYQHNLAWSSPTTPLTPEVNPRLLFERLFGVGSPEERAKNLAIRRKEKRSVLDFILKDARSLSNQVSGRDRQKLDEYFTSVRHRRAHSGCRTIPRGPSAAHRGRTGRRHSGKLRILHPPDVRRVASRIPNRLNTHSHIHDCG